MRKDHFDSALFWNYEQIARLVESEELPAMLVNLDVFDYNLKQFADRARKKNKKIRIASKSIRVPELIRRALDSHPDVFQGIMAYSPYEAAFLSDQGFDDILIAYPTIETSGIAEVGERINRGKNIVFMVDHPDHLPALQIKWPYSIPIPVCIDLDMSYKPLPFVHLGVRRSSLLTGSAFAQFCNKVTSNNAFSLKGIMGYEAQIAGMGECNPFSKMINPVKRLIKILSQKDVYAKRCEITAFLASKGLRLNFFNGGGTGSLASTSDEAWITEVTVGSGLLQAHLFDYYADAFAAPAFCFALRVTRRPSKKIATCQSGGFIASGETGLDKNPIPFLPKGMKCINREGFGEVQTPVDISHTGIRISIGDPVFFRPAKSGEIAEHFTQYLCFSSGKLQAPVITYRGFNRRFF